MPLFPLLREQLSGRGRPHLRRVLPWAQCPRMTAAETAQLREINALSAEQFDLLRRILWAWERADLNALNRGLQDCAAYFDPNKPHLLAYFVGLGGIDLFVTLLCDVNMPVRLDKASSRPLGIYDSKTHAPWLFLRAIATLMRVLTELLVCHNELGWHYYDRYPGLFFRLLELAKVTELRLTALVMLEHLVLSVGPVLEISKVPALQELIRTKDDATLAILCRVIALLIVPGVVLNQHQSPHQRLVYPETLLPLRRIQRVIDSNVLWLIGEKDLVRRLVRLCEVRGSGDPGAAMRTERLPHFLDDSLFDQLVRELSTTAIAAIPSLMGVVLPANALEDLDFGQRGQAASRGWDRSSSSSSSNNNNNNNSGDPAGSAGWGPAGDFGGASPQLRLPAMTTQWTDDDSSADSVEPAGSNVDFVWFVGCADAKQRWRLRDLTLREEVDDNRPMLSGFGPVTDSKAYEAFWKENRAFWRFLAPVLQNPTDSYSPQVIVGAQSEILFVLNLMLSTFFFGDVWCTLRDCHWISAASRFYDSAFELRAHHRSLSPQMEQLQRLSGLRRFPRFLPPGDDSAEVVPAEAEYGGQSRDDEAEEMQNGAAIGAQHEGIIHQQYHHGSSSDDGSSRHEWEGCPPALQMGEDSEAFIRSSTHQGSLDDEDGFDDKNHQHDPSTIRRLELLRGVHEFWNAQDRRECSMLHEGDTARESAPLALKIALTLAQQNEDSCVETSACHALEGYLRGFSFPVHKKNAADAPQTVLGKVLMRSILEHRVYNATYMPGLSGSLSPSKRIDSFFALLGELIRYHHDNLTLLQNYVTGAVDLLHLNNPSTASSLQLHPLHATSERVEQLLRRPPLDRGEHEPFAKVLLRRMHRHGCDTNLFLRSLLLSLTPGLRSKVNYVWKPVTAATVDAKDSLDGVARIGDVVTGHPERLNYIGRHSRRFVEILSERRQPARETSRETGAVGTGREASAAACAPPTTSAANSALSLWDMLQILLRSPHRLALEARPFPRFFDENDRALILAEVELPPIGPPPQFSLPLFPEMAADGEDDGGLSSLAELERALLQEPHKLVYSMLGPLNAERIQNAGRLCVVTTCVLVFVRAARLGGEAAVHEILRGLKTLAKASYEKWKEQRNSLHHCAKRWRQRGKPPRGCAVRPPREGSCYCTAGDGAARCPAFLVHGHCAPMSASEAYYHRYGGCFFRNMFRLLCVWIGHYGACQRYVETIYYCTEVPFAETKCVVLYLMRVLPDYFLP
ncbi:uncharacterized protein Tco025E_03665 [Trypanosoma conorhini]|uniref:Uncharacterized protein n=1 Tax=Trypanosoma conorhini TaxID=83891 RepID=A0A422PSH6_9TRYP|nr:uncharacterized protein Tco025E_03665 [Trypanosoma conorhini]RNF20648.1 hypothetical protein Tco025E_03665 [Trypanosoma conorhini]